MELLVLLLLLVVVVVAVVVGGPFPTGAEEVSCCALLLALPAPDHVPHSDALKPCSMKQAGAPGSFRRRPWSRRTGSIPRPWCPVPLDIVLGEDCRAVYPSEVYR
jgi:hypothetical protein